MGIVLHSLPCWAPSSFHSRSQVIQDKEQVLLSCFSIDHSQQSSVRIHTHLKPDKLSGASLVSCPSHSKPTSPHATSRQNFSSFFSPSLLSFLSSFFLQLRLQSDRCGRVVIPLLLVNHWLLLFQAINSLFSFCQFHVHSFMLRFNLQSLQLFIFLQDFSYFQFSAIQLTSRSTLDPSLSSSSGWK